MWLSEVIRKARLYGIDLQPNDFKDDTLDGMDPEEWLRDMLLD